MVLFFPDTEGGCGRKLYKNINRENSFMLHICWSEAESSKMIHTGKCVVSVSGQGWKKKEERKKEVSVSTLPAGKPCLCSVLENVKKSDGFVN